MICPFCLHKKTEVYNSRKTARLNRLWRRRRCLNCKREFTTYESIDPENILHISKDGATAPFSRSRLLLDLAKACDHRHDDAAYWLAASVEQKLLRLAAQNGGLVSAGDIRAASMQALKAFDATAFVKYLSYHTAATNDIHTLRRELKS